MKKRLLLSIIMILSISTFFTPKGLANENVADKVISIANSYIGVPYRYGGTEPSGFDCSGYTSYVFNKVGIKIPRTSGQQYNIGTAVSKSNLEAGDLVFFNTSGSSISHVGIYIGNSKFISATSSKGVKIDSINDPYYWGSRYVGAKRIIPEETPSVQALAPGEYVDVSKTFWAYEAITTLSKDGIIKGYNNKKFLPQKAITRAEAAKMLTETFALEVTTASISGYDDVPESHWAFEYVAAATSSEFFNGYEGNIFKPDEPISRAEVAALLTRAFELEQNADSLIFNDLPEQHWAYSSIQTLASHKIVNGYEDQTFKPSKQTTRAEFSSMLYSALNLKK